MPLQVSAPLHNGVLYLSFNQDCTCLALGDFKGIKIYSMETRKICYTMDIGAVRSACTISVEIVRYSDRSENPEY